MGKIYWGNKVLNMRDRVVKSVNTLIHYKTLKQGFRSPMSPRLLRKTDPAYECVRELDFALKNKDCNNVALTGIYGSGKSSIIKTVLQKHPFKKVLKLSLSRYISKEGVKDFDEHEEQKVERSIFQHILYKSSQERTPQSKYRRIPHYSIQKALFYAVYCILLMWSVANLWKPKWVDSLGIKNPFLCDKTREFFTKLSEWQNTIALAIIALAIVCILVRVIRRSSKFGIRSIKYKDIAFDVAEDNLDFNKLLEELLYFIKAGKYDYVIFEDLDRIEKPKELFLKFREINLLLNESEYYQSHHKRIVFVYAIRDDVFQEEERTKFFDYIIPVIPVVDHFNASDYLLKNYKAELDEIEDKDIMTLGLYITGIRQLLNIMNEYGVYKRILLRKPLSQKKLLAMTIYKNLYPQDYSSAHSKQGCLYGIFENKEEFSHLLTEADEKILEDVKKQIKETRDEVAKQRKVLAVWAQKKEENIIALIINEERHSLDEVIDRDDLYHQVETNAVEGYIVEEDGNEYRKKWAFAFNVIVNEVDEDGTYGDTMEELDNRLYNLVSIQNKVQKRIQTVTNYALQKIILTVNDSKKTLAVAKSICSDDANKASILHSLVRNGYIDDDYKAYFSFTYPGVMTSVDFEFVHSVLQGVSSDYFVELQSFDQILESLHTDNFSHESILNFSLLKYLLAKKDEVRLDPFVKTARNNPSFIVSAYLHEDINEDFFKRVFKGWNHCVREVLKISSESEQKTMMVLFWREAPIGLILDESEKAYLNGMYGNLSTIKQKAAIQITKDYNLKFERIRKFDEASKDLYDYILDHSNFSINAENLSVIFGEDFNTSSYTQVMKGRMPVYKYINENIASFMSFVPETDTNETPEALVEILNNKLIDQEILKKLLSKQVNKLNDFSKVNADAYGLLFEIDKIVPTWDSIGLYYATCPDEKGQVVKYIKKHVDELETSTVQEEEKELQTLLLTDNDTLSLEQYEKLASCFEYYFEISELTNLEDARLGILLNSGLIEYTKEAVVFFNGKPLERLTYFIIHFIDEIQNDAEFDLTFSNELSLRLLNSELSLEQKKWLLDTQISIDEGDNKQELVKQICVYSNLTGIDKDTDVSFVVEAMEDYTDVDGWKVKIDLTNAINASYSYNAEIEEKMIKALGGGYLDLNKIGGAPVFFDNNEENRTLLYYLRDKGHNVNKVIPEGNRIKVTFKRK